MTDSKPLDYSHLSVPERILLAQELWESVYDQAQDMPLTDAQWEEINRRWVAYEAGEMTTFGWAEVRERLRSRRPH